MILGLSSSKKISRMSEFVARVREDSIAALYRRDYIGAEKIFVNMSHTETLEKRAYTR